DRHADRRHLSRRAVVGCRRLGDRARGAASDHCAYSHKNSQHRGHRPRALHALCLLLRSGRDDPTCRNGRCHRAHAASPRARATPEHCRAGRSYTGNFDRGRESSLRTGSREQYMIIGLGHYLAVAAILFTLGIFGIFMNRKNVIVILMSIELILLAVNINLVAFSTHLGDIVGQIYALLVLTVAAAESAIGLAILVVFYRNRGSIAVEDINLMKG